MRKDDGQCGEDQRLGRYLQRYVATLAVCSPPNDSPTAEFDKLVRMVQRQQNVSEPIPPFFIRQLVNLEGALNTAMAKEKEAKKKMNAANARGLNGMRQKVKKVTKEYEAEVKRFQAVSPNPGRQRTMLTYSLCTLALYTVCCNL